MSDSTGISNSILSDEEGDHIVVKCGVVEGKFYYGRLNCSSGNLGTVKCIHFNNEWLSPNEFEVKGGVKRGIGKGPLHITVRHFSLFYPCLMLTKVHSLLVLARNTLVAVPF